MRRDETIGSADPQLTGNATLPMRGLQAMSAKLTAADERIACWLRYPSSWLLLLRSLPRISDSVPN